MFLNKKNVDNWVKEKGPSSLINNLFFLILILVISTSYSWAKNLIKVDMPQDFDGIESIELIPVSNNLIYLLSNKIDDNQRFVVMKKNQNGEFKRVADKSLTSIGLGISEIGAISKYNDASVDVFGLLELLDIKLCENCQTTTFIVALSENGTLDKRRNELGFAQVPVSECQNQPSLWQASSGVLVFDGCEKVLKYNERLELEKEVTLPESLINKNLQAENKPFYDVSEGVASLVKEPLLLYFNEDNSFKSLTINEDLTFSDIDVFKYPSQYDKCQVVEGDKLHYFCSDYDLLGIYDISGIKLDGEFNTSPVLGEDNSYTNGDILDVWREDSHFYINQKRKYEKTENTQEIEKNIIGNFNEVGDVYTTKVIEGVDSDVDFKLSTTGDFSASLVINSDATLSLSVFDNLNLDSPARLVSPIGGSLLTNQEFEQKILFEDEETLYRNIDLSFKEAPSWFDFYKGEDGLWYAIANPYHDQLTSFDSYLNLIDSNGGNSEFDFAYTPTLTPLVLLVKEDELFESLGIDEPVPYDSLLGALEIVSILEDEVYSFKFSYTGRLNEEVSIDFFELPTYASWDEENLTLNILAGQEDVKSDEVINFILKDSFAENPISITLPIEIVEKEEPPFFTSEPVTKAMVGERYLYELFISDEETATKDLSVNLLTSPDWLIMSRIEDRILLQGIPDKGNEGVLVQVSVSDDFGFFVLQTFTINVDTEDEENEDSGAFYFWELLLLLIVVAQRRCFSRTRALT